MSAIMVEPGLGVPSVLLLILIGVGLSIQNIQTVSYGEPCSINDIEGGCDTSAFQKCDRLPSSTSDDEGKCVCESTTDMFYNETLLICAVFAERSCQKNPNCIANAFCSIDSICKCDPDGYRFHIGGVCLLWHNQTCTKDSECHYGAHMRCLEHQDQLHQETQEVGVHQRDIIKSCDCKPDTHVWSDEHDTCVGLHGTQCLTVLNEKCVENASCNSDQACECRDGYSPTPGNNCLLRYGSRCDNETLFCNHYNNLKCSESSFGDINNKSECECESPEIMQYEPEDDKCFVKLGQSCEFKRFQGAGDERDGQISMDRYDCISNSECGLGEQEAQPICRCSDGHFDNGRGKCEQSASGRTPNYSGSIGLVLMGLVLIITIWNHWNL